MRCARFVAALIAGVSLAGNSAARADDYPSRPITLILPLGAGGAMDILARAQFEPKLKERLGKPVVIENRTGGGTVIAATATAKAPPDGYTLFMAPAGTLTTNATLYKKLPYDPAKDFTPIALTSSVAFVLVVHPSLPVHSVKELMAYIKERPGQLAFGSTGIGATPHLAFEIMMRDAGLKMTHVPYRGMPQAVNDVVGNHVQMVFADPAGAPAADQGRQASSARGVVAAAHRRAAGRADDGRGRVEGLRGGVVAHDRRPRRACRRKSSTA